jgi:hypothetical protein
MKKTKVLIFSLVAMVGFLALPKFSQAGSDLTPPTVTDVDAPTIDSGTYSTGTVIPIVVTFSEPVNVTGTPVLGVWVAGANRWINYTSGSGTDKLTFEYTVAANDYTDKLDYSGTDALRWAGDIKDLAGNVAVMDLASPGEIHSLGYNRTIVISDTSSPTVTNVDAPTIGGGTYGVDTVIPIVVTFDEPVDVMGDLFLRMRISDADRWINYTSGTGTDKLTFEYTVEAGDYTDRLDYSATDSLATGEGSVKDLAGNDAILTLASPGYPQSLGYNRTIIIDTINTQITGFLPIADVDAGTAGSAIFADADAVKAALPSTVDANEVSGVTVSFWDDNDSYNPNVAGSYTFIGYVGDMPAGYANGGGFYATVEVVVSPATTDEIAAAFDEISATLEAAGIANNLDDVDRTNYASFSNLYFEKSIDGVKMGRITFNDPLDLSSDETKAFLQNLGTKMDMAAAGVIGLDFTGATSDVALMGVSATIKFYGLDRLGFDTSLSDAALTDLVNSKLIALDDEGNVLDKAGLIPTAGTYVGACEVGGGCKSFSVGVNHFTKYKIDGAEVKKKSSEHKHNKYYKLYKKYKKYNTVKNKAIYNRIKLLKRENFAEFLKMREIYKTYKKLSWEQRSLLPASTLQKFNDYKRYNNYKLMRDYKKRGHV